MERQINLCASADAAAAVSIQQKKGQRTNKALDWTALHWVHRKSAYAASRQQQRLHREKSKVFTLREKGLRFNSTKSSVVVLTSSCSCTHRPTQTDFKEKRQQQENYYNKAAGNHFGGDYNKSKHTLTLTHIGGKQTGELN